MLPKTQGTSRVAFMEPLLLVSIGIVAIVVIAAVVVSGLWTATSPLDRIRAAVDRGEHGEARRLAEFALDASPNDLMTALILEELSGIHRFVGDHAESEDCCRRALVIRCESLPADHRDIGVSSFNLGLSLLAGSKIDEAELHFRRAVQSHRLSPDSSDADLALALKGHSQACAFLARFDEAEVLLAEAITIADRSLGDGHPFTAEIRLFSAQFLTLCGRYHPADRDYLRAARLFEAIRGRDDPMTLVTLQQYANLKLGRHRLTGDAAALVDAEALIDEYRDACEAKFGLDHVMTAEAYRTLARLRALQGLFAESVEAARFALRIGEARVGPEHIATLDKSLVLARSLDGVRAFDEAERRVREALQVMENTFGRNHLELGDPYELFGRLAHRQGRHDEAEQHMRRSLALREPLGCRHPLRAFTLRELVPVLHATGRRIEAGEAELEIAAIVAHAERQESASAG